MMAQEDRNRQVTDLVGLRMLHCVNHINAALGRGYAAEHPELLSSMIKAATIESTTLTVSEKIQDLDNSIETAIALFMEWRQE